MSSVVGKRVNGRTYYYLAESARVGGEPRVVSQRYLGTAEEIGRAVSGPTSAPEGARHRTFGDVAAVWATLEMLEFVKRVDEAVGPQRARTTLGTHLALAVLHCSTAPGTDSDAWWADCAADDFVRPRPARSALSAAARWRALQRLTPERVTRIETTIAEAVHGVLGDGHAALAVDVPQFTTFISADCSMPACRGGLAGLGLVVTRDGAIPLASHVYPRDGVEVPPFAELAGELRARHPGEVTLVFNAGQAPQLDLGGGRHFVGALPLAEHPELHAKPASARKRVDADRFAGLTALDTRATVDGVRRRVILTHSETLHAAQARALTEELSTATRELAGLAAALTAGTLRGDRAQINAEIARLTRGRRVERVLSTTLSGARPGDIRLTWRVDEAAVARLDEEFFGKQVLVTDHDDWPVSEVVTAYRARNHLDSTFRWLTGQAVTGPAPRWEWTRHRIAVHTLVSVLSATVTHLMRREADRAGMNLSVRELMDQLAGIGETVLRYPSTGGRPRTQRILTHRDHAQQQLFALFGLSAFAPV
ncbi:IS1634 family transposase [Amycolatopsis sp. H20-H5]|uniref:IS1634 family transposase n=1 Tax=Amycolatopsis sp. H20-H5 TaxID=3046309 RepID=UPI002DBE517E|nr:transposase [Amycolatopsis sp. H20-H5]MEC3982062.1 transposase [Amycolatopsis sp. H20-H5]